MTARSWEFESPPGHFGKGERAKVWFGRVNAEARGKAGNARRFSLPVSPLAFSLAPDETSELLHFLSNLTTASWRYQSATR